eukprot:2324053-Amphidinium_carterae.1
MFIETHQQARQRKIPGQENKFVMFMINYAPDRTTSILTQKQDAQQKKLTTPMTTVTTRDNEPLKFEQPNIRQLPQHGEDHNQKYFNDEDEQQSACE